MPSSVTKTSPLYRFTVPGSMVDVGVKFLHGGPFVTLVLKDVKEAAVMPFQVRNNVGYEYVFTGIVGKPPLVVVGYRFCCFVLLKTDILYNYGNQEI